MFSYSGLNAGDLSRVEHFDIRHALTGKRTSVHSEPKTKHDKVRQPSRVLLTRSAKTAAECALLSRIIPSKQVNSVKKIEDAVRGSVENDIERAQETKTKSKGSKKLKSLSISSCRCTMCNPENTTNKRFQCIECWKRFAKSAYLSTHQRHVHPKNAPFVCDLCNSKFKIRRYLKQHQKRCSGDRPYVCQRSECGKTFATEHDLKMHVDRVHSGRNRCYSCKFCAQTFKTSNRLERHMQGHEFKDYRCKLCPKVYTSRKTFMEHLRVFHSGSII